MSGGDPRRRESASIASSQDVFMLVPGLSTGPRSCRISGIDGRRVEQRQGIGFAMVEVQVAVGAGVIPMTTRGWGSTHDPGGRGEDEVHGVEVGERRAEELAIARPARSIVSRLTAMYCMLKAYLARMPMASRGELDGPRPESSRNGSSGAGEERRVHAGLPDSPPEHSEAHPDRRRAGRRCRSRRARSAARSSPTAPRSSRAAARRRCRASPRSRPCCGAARCSSCR